jgi:membrane protein DedA with SNARE-associated domain
LLGAPATVESSGMFEGVIAWLEQMALSVPLPLFVSVGGIVEEILAPIPSPLVSVMAGSVTAAQEWGVTYLLWICAIATVAKTVGAWLFYVLGDKLEDVAVPRFGKYIGVSHQDLEHFGEHFNGTQKDTLILLIIRAIPVMPSTPISLLCGILKIRMHTFVLATLIGFYIRNLTFMLIGYTGLHAMESLMQGIDMAETVLKLAIVGGGLAVLAWLYWKRRTGHPAKWLKWKR